MKLSAATLALFAATVSARKLSPEAARKVLRTARRLDQNQNQDQDEDENAYLAKYSLKFISCSAENKIVDQDGNAQYGTAIIRACPTDAGCSGDYGCKEGYGDYLVAIEDFVDAYMDDQADNMGWDDDRYDMNKFAKCDEYEPDNDGANDDQYANYQFFVGPTCTDDGTDIKLGFFSNEYCTLKSDIDFETVSNGWTLPYSSGGLVSTSCIDCVEYDNGNYQLKDMCNDMMGYDENQPKTACETNMEYYSYYGQNTRGCEKIEELLPKGAKPGSAGAVFGWIIFILLIVGVAGYVMWWRKKKQASGASDGMLA